jgi:hypothetical protein
MENLVYSYSWKENKKHWVKNTKTEIAKDFQIPKCTHSGIVSKKA